jgi:hypothetical protein
VRGCLPGQHPGPQGTHQVGRWCSSCFLAAMPSFVCCLPISVIVSSAHSPALSFFLFLSSCPLQHLELDLHGSQQRGGAALLPGALQVPLPHPAGGWLARAGLGRAAWLDSYLLLVGRQARKWPVLGFACGLHLYPCQCTATGLPSLFDDSLPSLLSFFPARWPWSLWASRCQWMASPSHSRWAPRGHAGCHCHCPAQISLPLSSGKCTCLHPTPDLAPSPAGPGPPLSTPPWLPAGG